MRILKKELLVMWVAIAVIVLMCLRPPQSFHYKLVLGAPNLFGAYTKVKYAWIWAEPPKSQHGRAPGLYNYTGGKLEATRLIVQCFVVALLAGGVIVTMRAKRPDS